MSDDERLPGDGSGKDDFERMFRELFQGLGGEGAPGLDPGVLASAAGLPQDPAALGNLFGLLRQAMQNPGGGIDWSITRKTALEVARSGGGSGDRGVVDRSFPVASLWLEESTEVGASPDAPRAISRVEWVQQTVDTWVSFAEPVAQSISDALTGALGDQLPESMAGQLQGIEPMLRSVGGALFATQLGQVVGRLSHEVAAGGDIGIPLFEGPGKEGGALIPSGVAAFADGLEQDLDAVTLYLAVRELAHARLFRHAKWLRLALLTAVGEYARGIRIETSHIEDLAHDIDPQNPEQLRELMTSGALIPPKTAEQETAHVRLETTLALIEGWVDAVTADAVSRLPDAEAIAEMVRRRRATGGPAERTFSSLVGLELRPRRLREAAAMWRLVAEYGGAQQRDGLWAHPDLLPTTEEIDDPQLLLRRLGLTEDPSTESDSFDEELGRLLSGDVPPHDDQGSEA